MTPIQERTGKKMSAWWRTPAWAALAVAVVLSVPRLTHAQRPPQRRPGKVLLIRGAFTVFSLGLDTLGDKLKEYGLDVEVVPAFMASTATDQIRDEYLRHPMPIVIIGHSKGGHLAPECAEELGKSRIPVRLVVIVDNPHEVAVPPNVERCVNFYQTNILGIVQGAFAKAESPRTQLFNLDVDRLPHRDEGGYIDHFNIHSSPWVHSMIIGQVLRACPAEVKDDDSPRVIYRDRLTFPPGQLKVRR
jgi:hypothetical protein